MAEPAPSTFTAACVQLNAGDDVEDNLIVAGRLIREAADAGAALVMTPECTNLMSQRRKVTLERTRPEAEDTAIPAFRALAAELDIWLLAGSFAIKLGEDQVANRSFLFTPKGEIAARYDKIHMFDVDVPDGQTYRESKTYRPGERAVLAELPWGKLGLTVCYDLRFPQLYRRLARAGAAFLTVPAAFTQLTGEAHWHVLLRARAIETGCFVFAPAQCGRHPGGRETFGHSLIVAPWGEILADGGEAPGITLAKIDPARVVTARNMVPSLRNEREFAGP
jgi:predicted amidohydrolase